MTHHCWIVSWYNGDHLPHVDQYVWLGDTPSGGVFVQLAGHKKAIRKSPSSAICRSEDELRDTLEPMLREREQRAKARLLSIQQARKVGIHINEQRSEPWPKIENLEL